MATSRLGPLPLYLSAVELRCVRVSYRRLLLPLMGHWSFWPVIFPLVHLCVLMNVFIHPPFAFSLIHMVWQ